ncbi:hypothetical protein [Pseudoalteromonas sp. JB197]|uniref:hypothetical protein n=1 Tax=Pseudoalteromonas sp. JB197 TaxID=1434839 RepID=UPI00097F0B22|nr:hypothetical protein [Pseudoalteromonas sp. JB197]PCC14031.1 hypothetical protein CIK86_12630 [Pseudoalteromonas sp. JB197]SJN30504.1 hypothetical protein CZ797_06130 [Pseudoalteromonas sp. JB197]
MIYQFPSYTKQIIELLSKQDWFIHSFPLNKKEEIYNPAGFLHNFKKQHTEYTIHLDLNIYQYVLNAFKKSKNNNLHRSAIALVVFAKLTNVKFDPTIAIYEKLNYKNQCPDELIDDLILFRQIDNADIDLLALFSLGHTNNIELPYPEELERLQLKAQLTKYQKLKKWDTLYVFVLKITELYFCENSLSNESKLESFWCWCHEEFLFSLVATCFAIKLFGMQSIPKLMKYSPKLTAEENKKHLTNMTWDLFLLDKFFEKWVNKTEQEQFIYASNDKPLKEVLKIAIEVQNNDKKVDLSKDLSGPLINSFLITLEKIMTQQGRRISIVTDFKSFRDDIIDDYECLLKVRV